MSMREHAHLYRRQQPADTVVRVDHGHSHFHISDTDTFLTSSVKLIVVLAATLVVHGRGCNPRAPKPLKYKFFKGHQAPTGRTAPIF